MLFEAIAKTSAAVAATRGKKKKVELIAATLLAAPPEERAMAARYLAGETGHKTGAGYATVAEVRPPPAASASLGVTEVDRRLAELVALEGPGSTKARKELLGALLVKMTAAEQDFAGALILGALRQGALDALVIDALAHAKALEPKAVRTAYMLAGEIGAVAEAVLTDGPAALPKFGLTLFRPILPMLAQTAEDAGEAIASFDGPASLELKLDGFRVQIHKLDDAVKVYSRALNDVTEQVPEVVAMAKALPAKRLILDGEALALGPTGRPLPFQDTMSRQRTLSLSLFDLLLLDGQTLLGATARERFAALDALAPAHKVPRVETKDAAEAIAFYDRAIAAGHEGVMAKALESPYDAGSRGAAWLKIKKVRQLDLVVIGVDWGSGRRHGTLSNIHLAARDPKGGFVMVSKTFKGMTDETLAWQTKELLAREVDREGPTVHVRPELVVEIAFNDVLRSTQYAGGVALRHARLVRYRPDKTADQADTIDAVRAIAIADGVLTSGR